MRVRRTVCLLILLLGITLIRRGELQSAPQATSASEHEKCVIEGVVTRVPGGDPIKGVEVFLSPVDSYKSLYSTDTDAAGQFSLSDVEPGKYQIWLRKTGYDSPDRRCDSDKVQEGDDLNLVSGQKLPGLKFQLLASAVVAGTVFDPSGDPLTGAEVQAVRFYSFRGERRISSATSGATSDDRGQYRLFHLSPGRYFLRVKDAFYFRQRFEESEDKTTKEVKGFLPIYYPDTTDLGQATLLELKPGEELAGFDFTIHPAQVLRIRGRVINGLTGERINVGSVALDALPPTIRENGGSAISLNEVDQQFTIDNLVPGRYIVSVLTWVLPDRKRWGGWQEIDLTDSSVDDIPIKVFPGNDLMGRVQEISGKKLDFPHLQVLLEPHDDLVYGHTFTRVSADGSFLLLDVKQDTYDIDLAGLPESYYLKSARLGTVEAVEDGLKIGGESPTLPLVLEVSMAGGQVDGVVRTGDGKSACTSTVVLIPDGNRRSIQRYYQSTEVDRSGHFVLRGIAPGAYRLFAFDNAGEIGYRDPGSLQPYENQGHPVQIGESDRRTVVLKLIATANENP
jgi:Carboxypeptidase regulatory-like domain